MQRVLAQTAEAPWFQHFVTAVILFAGVVVGIETYPAAVERYGTVLHALNDVVLWIFVAEIVVKMGAHGRKPWRYFLDPWNVFDFAIVAVCFMPINAQYVTVLRLARLLRVLKLVRALPKLQVLVGALLKSIPSMVYVSVLLFLLFYLYGVAGTFMFAENDPVHFRNLQMSMLSLFRAVTLEDWTDLMYINMYGSAKYGYDAAMLAEWNPVSRAMPVGGAFFFVSFVLMGTMIILNLFIGVIMNGMDEAQAEAEEAELIRLRGGGEPTIEDELASLQKQLAVLNETVARVQRMARKDQAA
jgi:voltage-gated sodium channel